MKKPGIDAFAVLGVTRSHKYVAVKSAFLQIAMKHHPDTVTADTEDERESSKEIFVAARKAFEAIVAGPDGLAILKSETADYVDEDLDQWFKSETGYDMPFMDAATMKEVAEMTESVGGGLDRDGGMWTLARMVADTVKSGGDGRSLLQLEAGVVRDRSIDGILRRKRRR
jgi:DnaJ domain